MTEVPPETEIRDYYQRVHLAEDRVDALLVAGDLVTAARRWKRLAIAACVGMAAMTLLAIGLYAGRPGAVPEQRLSGPSTLPPGTSILAENAPRMQSAGEGVGVDGAEAVAQPPSATEQAPKRFRLVAFRSHDDRCPHCRATGRVYQDLARSLQDAPIEFEQFDLSKANSRSETDQRIEELQLTSLVSGRLETAFLALISTEGTQIHEFKPSMQSERIETRVREIVSGQQEKTKP